MGRQDLRTPRTYRCILADPPWLERGGGKSKRGADRHYPLMPKKDILRTMRDSGHWRPDRSGCHLWLWTTSNFLKDALWLMECLGFEYKTSAVWVKVDYRFDGTTGTWSGRNRPTFRELLASMLQIGLGQYMRHAHEWLLFGMMGKVIVPESESRMPSVIFAPRTKHSKKPEEAFNLIEPTSPGPRIEFFAREKRPGWDCWGNEV